MTSLRLLRTVSLCEGVSFLLLLFVAMPLKYFAGIPEAVKYTGWAHGFLFIALLMLLLQMLVAGRLPFVTVLLTGIAALLPGGPFLMDRRLKRHESADPA